MGGGGEKEGKGFSFLTVIKTRFRKLRRDEFFGHPEKINKRAGLRRASLKQSCVVCA